MNNENQTFLRELFTKLEDMPLEPSDPRYVQIYGSEGLSIADPIEKIFKGIEWSHGESSHLLTGYRGCGKSTELRRLRKYLTDEGYKVLLCDLADYINLHEPLDIIDLLFALAGAIDEGLGSEDSSQGWWTQVLGWMRTRKIEFEEISFGLEANIPGTSAGAAVKLALKEDPDFRRHLQERLAGHLGSLVAEVRTFIQRSVAEARSKEDAPIALLVDSISEIRGALSNFAAVQESVDQLFNNHADKLRLPDLHVVYTVPIYLSMRSPAVGAGFRPGGIAEVGPIPVFQRDGSLRKAGVDAARKMLCMRGDCERLLGRDPALFERLIEASGGHQRDLIRLARELTLALSDLPAESKDVEQAIATLCKEMLPIPDDDALWMAKIDETGEANIATLDEVASFCRLFDNHLVLRYENGSSWYRMHPVVRDRVLQQVASLAPRDDGSA